MDVNRSTVLILSPDALSVALVGALVELEGLQPAFASAEEPPRDALLRTRPRFVLVDVEHPSAVAAQFIGPATMVGARILLFGSSRSTRDLSQAAADHGLDSFTLPIGHAAFARLLADGAAG
jgi:hypothetical protein